MTEPSAINRTLEERARHERELKRRRDEEYIEGAKRYARAEAFREGPIEALMLNSEVRRDECLNELLANLASNDSTPSRSVD